MNSFNDDWKKSEESFAQHFRGVPVGLPMQYKDIDVMLNEGRWKCHTVSIKDIGDSSKRYGSVLVETSLVNTRNGKKAKGSFYKCEADFYAIRLHHKGRYCWYVTSTNHLRKLVSQPHPVVHTRKETERRNREQGRVYDGSECVRIKVSDLIGHGKCIVVPEGAFKPTSKHYNSVLRGMVEKGFWDSEGAYE